MFARRVLRVVANHPTQGNEAWVSEPQNRYHDEFERASPMLWTTLVSGQIADEVHSASGNGYTAGKVAFVRIHEAG